MSVPQFTHLAAQPNRCLHEQRRRGLQTLFCVKQAGHIGKHLHDVHPGGSRWVRETQSWVYGEQSHSDAVEFNEWIDVPRPSAPEF